MSAPKRGASDKPASPHNVATVMSETSESTTTPESAGEASPRDEFLTFMVGLATDPGKLGAFMKDPDASMTAASIDAVDQAILKSGNPATIHARLRGQRFSFTPPGPPIPATILDVNMPKQSGSPESVTADQPTVRTQTGFSDLPIQGSSTMFPNTPLQIAPPQQVFPQIHPQQVFPQIHPQQVFPQIHPQQVFPQIHPQQVFPQIHPQQVFPQIHPQQVFPQIHPQQVFPQIHPQQVFPQIHPQQVFPQIHPQQVFPQIHPQQVFPQIHPQQVFPQIYPQQVFPQIHPQQVFPQIHPQQVFPQIHPQQVFPQIHPQQVFPQIHPQQVFPQIFPQFFGATPGPQG